MNEQDMGARTDSDGMNYCVTLEDIDMDLLVGTGFNKTAFRESPRDVEPTEMTVEDLDPDSALLQPQSFFSVDLLGEVSPRNISDDRELPLDKECLVPFLSDSRDFDGPQQDPSEARPHTALLSYPGAITAEPLCTQPLSLDQLVALPESVMLDDEFAAFASSPFASENGWQDVTPMTLSTSPENAPPACSNQLLLLPPEEQKPPPFQKQQYSQLQPVLGSVDCPTTATAEIDSRLKTENIPVKPSKKKREKVKDGINRGAKAVLETQPVSLGLDKALKKKLSGRRKAGANSHLSLEERKKLRAERNRESAEKSRMRRKQMVLELETNVAFLREENRDLKAKVEKYHGQLTTASEEVTRRAGGRGEGAQVATMEIPMLYEALSALQRCVEECPRTFHRGPRTPVIPLNISRTPRR